MKPGPKRKTLEERFWSKVDKGDGTGCWLWAGGLYWDGYGKFMIRDENDKPVERRAHRVSWNFSRSGLTDDIKVLHRCDCP